MKEKIPDDIRRLNYALSQNNVWRNLAKKTSEVINEIITDNRWALSRIREPNLVQRGDWMNTPVGRGKVTLVRRKRSNINETTNTYDFEDTVEIEIPDQGFVQLPVRTLLDRETLIAGSKLSGFDYFSDYLQDDDYARIHAYIAKFWNANGGERFVELLGYIHRVRFDIEQLWEYDTGDPGAPADYKEPLSDVDEYNLLEPFNQALSPVWEDPSLDPNDPISPHAGNVYPTAHVGLSYDILDHSTIDRYGVASLFYYLAPIHLVLSRFVGTIYVHEDLYAGVTVQGNVNPQFQQIWDNDARINRYWAGLSQLSCIPQFMAKQDTVIFDDGTTLGKPLGLLLTLTKAA